MSADAETPLEMVPPECLCIPSLCETGVACLYWMDAAGEWQCIPAPETGTKYIKCDNSGFFPANG